jgi:hypothetical protein
MSDPLATYLHDHLAGSHFAIKLLDSLGDQYRNQELGAFAVALRAEIKQDQDTRQQIINHVGTASTDLREVAGWVGEMASQFKFHRDSRGGLGTFEALETLTLGIRGKLALWRTLLLIRQIDPRIPEQDYKSLAARAEEQFTRAEQERLRQAQTTFKP